MKYNDMYIMHYGKDNISRNMKRICFPLKSKPNYDKDYGNMACLGNL